MSTLVNGNRVRILSQPIYLVDSSSDHRAISGVLQAATPLDIFDTTLSRLTIFLAVASCIMLVVAAVGANVVAGRALRVVNNVTRQARHIETSRDLSQRIPEPRTDDEVGNLVRTFNQMLARLEAAFEAQRRFVADSPQSTAHAPYGHKGQSAPVKRATEPAERAEIIAITEAETSRLNRMVKICST